MPGLVTVVEDLMEALAVLRLDCDADALSVQNQTDANLGAD